jgi:glycosyltransferase involved in cell wall biosynthesis
MAPFASRGGYSSEAWSYVASLDGNIAAGVGNNFTLSIAHHGDLKSSEFWHGLPKQSKNLAHRLAAAQCELSRAIVVCHNEPGSWYPPVQGSLSCPPTGYDEPKFVIGRTMFETDHVSPVHVKRCNQMDAVWVPTDFHVSTFVKSGVDASKVVKVVQAVDVAFFDPAKHAALPLPIGFSAVLDDARRNHVKPKGQGFVFLSVFKWEQRKGWDVLLRAFLQEFSGADDVALYLLIHAYQSGSDFGGKIHRFMNSSSFVEPVGGWAEVWVVEEHIPQSSLPRLYKAADAFVLPSHGEGWGRPVVEAMAMELPVIVTNWSGPTEYLTEENGYPLDVDRMSEVIEGPFKRHLCAEPSIDHLRALMRRVFVDREEARIKGRKAREDMIERFSPEVVARIVADQIQQALART